MDNILTLASGINVMHLQLQLKRNPQLWNTRTERTQSPESPHREVSDIWLRYSGGAFEDSRKPHESVWFDSADLLSEVKKHARHVMTLVQGDALGGILITRIPPGGKVYPHVDGGWNAETFDKFALQIASHQQQAFCYADGQHVTMPGDLYWFNNQESHWVINDSPVERITMIVCVKLDKPFGGL